MPAEPWHSRRCVTYIVAADQSRMMQEQMTGAAMAMPADTNKAFKVHSHLFLASLKLQKALADSYLKDGFPEVSVACMVPSFKFKFSKNLFLFTCFLFLSQSQLFCLQQVGDS